MVDRIFLKKPSLKRPAEAKNLPNITRARILYNVLSYFNFLIKSGIYISGTSPSFIVFHSPQMTFVIKLLLKSVIKKSPPRDVTG